MSNRQSAVKFDESAIDAVFADLNQCHFPGAAVGIAIEGRPVYRKAFGLASVDLATALTPSTRMRIGSTSKHFTALAYLLLCEEGKAGLDDPVGKYFPKLHPVTHRITMRQLMGNISGLREVGDLVVQFSGVGGRRITSKELVSFYKGIDDVNAAPDTTFIYCNGGWMILSEIIERISDQSLESFLWERIFKPIGMYDTTARRWNASFVPNSASSHVKMASGDWIRTESWGGIDGAGSGCIVSTVDDMLRWMAHMDTPNVGSVLTWETLKTPQILPNGTSTGYGLGLFTTDYRGVTTIQHAGGVFGSNSQMLKIPAAGLDVVVMVNRSDKSGVELADRIVDACLPDLEPAIPPYRGPCATGVFCSQKTGRVVYLFEDSSAEGYPESAQIAAVDGHHLPVCPDATGALKTVNPVSYLKYSLTLGGNPQHPSSVLLEDFGNVDELVAVDASIRTDVGEIAGRYRSDGTDTDITIHAADRPYLDAVGRFGSARHNLEALADGIWRTSPQDELALPPWGLLVFDSDRQGFRFCDIATRNLRFKRIG